jgi:membrane protein
MLQWIEDEPFLLAAALSYYTLLSLAPLLVIAIAVAGFAFGRPNRDKVFGASLVNGFLSFAMVPGIGFLLLVSLVVSAFVTGLTTWMGGLLGGVEFIVHALDLLVSFVFITALFAMIYKFLPDVHIQWRDVWIGAAITALLFTIDRLLHT